MKKITMMSHTHLFRCNESDNFEYMYEVRLVFIYTEFDNVSIKIPGLDKIKNCNIIPYR